MTDTYNGYSTGDVQLKLNATNCPMTGCDLDFSNACFAFYYAARQNIKNCPDSTHRGQMLSALAECATNCGGAWDLAAWGTWWAGEPRNLIDTMARFKADGKQWKLKAKGVYFATESSPVYSGACVQNAPLSLKQFADAVNAKFAGLMELAKKHNEWAEAAAALKTADGQKGYIDKVLDTAEKAKPLLWLAHPEFEEKVLAAVEGPLGFAGLLSTALGYLSTASKNFTVSINGQSVTMTGLQIVASMIPVFGEFYATAIESIPVITNWAHGIVKKEVDMLAPIYGKQAGQIYSGWQAYQHP